MNHPESCDIDPVTLTWKRNVEKNESATICLNCLNKIEEMGKIKYATKETEIKTNDETKAACDKSLPYKD